MAKSASDIEKKNSKWYPIGTGIAIFALHLLIKISKNAYDFAAVGISKGLWLVVDFILIGIWAIFAALYVINIQKDREKDEGLFPKMPFIMVIAIFLWLVIWFHDI